MRCFFCGNELEWGTGKMMVAADGRVTYFCSTKCERNSAKREPRAARWTAAGRREKAARAPPQKVQKPAAPTKAK